ncbi:MAG: hypothetical protein AAFX06_24445 [Planctomycetota bacterium]
MRISLFQLLTFLLIIALAMGLIVNHRQSKREIRGYQTRVEASERLEDPFERELVEGLSSGDSLDDLPLYRLLVDRVTTPSDPDYPRYLRFIEKNLEDAPESLDGCELHEFTFFSAHGGAEHTYVVIVRDNRCELVFWAQTFLHPV